MTYPRRQHGITLVTALILLVVLTLLALTTFNLGKSNLQIVSNMQQRDEAQAAANDGFRRHVFQALVSLPNPVGRRIP